MFIMKGRNFSKGLFSGSHNFSKGVLERQIVTLLHLEHKDTRTQKPFRCVGPDSPAQRNVKPHTHTYVFSLCEVNHGAEIFILASMPQHFIVTVPAEPVSVGITAVIFA